MIYWHVDANATCIYSQLKRCSSSEVASMIEGVLHHGAEIEIEKQFVDTHGQSLIAFAFCALLGFDLMPRLKGIERQKLVRPGPKDVCAYPNLEPLFAPTPIQWSSIAPYYDEMVKMATALVERTAEPEAILRRFARGQNQHPVCAALLELGKAVKTTFLCEYLRSEELRREINAGLNVVETWNGLNSFIHFGKSGEFQSNQIEAQEISALSLHLLQACLVHVNTLMIEEVLDEEDWRNRMTERDMAGLSPLPHGHYNPYGRIDLDMSERLPLAPTRLAA
jgi:TnpA family transposase